MFLRVTFTAAIVAALVSIAADALAWGPEGHAIVADIAEAHLTPAASHQIAQLLGLENHAHLDEVSSWADEVRMQRHATAPWHFVDIPLESLAYDPARDCAGGDCVVQKIVDFERVLADKSASAEDRLEALKWVVHFVGDIHQPLHAEDNGDRGGNEVRLTFFQKSSNLHSIWDGAILEHALDLHLGPNFTFDHEEVRIAAAKLDGAISRTARTTWAPTGMTTSLDRTTAGWANDSHKLAQTVVYPDLPIRRRGDWFDIYEQQAWPVVEGQLQHAGVRLAELLNEALP